MEKISYTYPKNPTFPCEKSDFYQKKKFLILTKETNFLNKEI